MPENHDFVKTNVAGTNAVNANSVMTFLADFIGAKVQFFS
jgi:hypothetical protein